MNPVTKRFSCLQPTTRCFPSHVDAGSVQPGASFSAPGPHGRGPHQSAKLRRAGADLGRRPVRLAAQLRRPPVVPAVEGLESVLPRRRAGRRQRQDVELDVRRDGALDTVRLSAARTCSASVTSRHTGVAVWR